MCTADVYPTAVKQCWLTVCARTSACILSALSCVCFPAPYVREQTKSHCEHRLRCKMCALVVKQQDDADTISLIDLPDPILHDILYNRCDVASLCMLAQTCTQLWQLIGMTHVPNQRCSLTHTHSRPRVA